MTSPQKTTCQYPGCNVVVPRLDGGSPVKYCGKEHRLAARRMRAQQRQTAAPDRPGTAPAPTPPAEPAATTPAAKTTSKQRGNGAIRSPYRFQLRLPRSLPALPRSLPALARWVPRRAGFRRRWVLSLIAVLAVLGMSAGLLAGAGGRSSRPSASRSQAAVTAGPRPSAAPSRTSLSAVTLTNWSAKARRTLAALDGQLRVVNDVARLADTAPATRRSRALRTLLRTLAAHRTALLRQRAAIQSALATYHAYQQAPPSATTPLRPALSRALAAPLPDPSPTTLHLVRQVISTLAPHPPAITRRSPQTHVPQTRRWEVTPGLRHLTIRPPHQAVPISRNGTANPLRSLRPAEQGHLRNLAERVPGQFPAATGVANPTWSLRPGVQGHLNNPAQRVPGQLPAGLPDHPINGIRHDDRIVHRGHAHSDQSPDQDEPGPVNNQEPGSLREAGPNPAGLHTHPEPAPSPHHHHGDRIVHCGHAHPDQSPDQDEPGPVNNLA